MDLTKIIVSQGPLSLDPLLCCFDLIEGLFEIYSEFKKQQKPAPLTTEKPAKKQKGSNQELKKQLNELKKEIKVIKNQNNEAFEHVKNQNTHNPPFAMPNHNVGMVQPPLINQMPTNQGLHMNFTMNM